ncbi:MAG: DUF2207 domain-containing protein [Candidatus Saccharimonadales bacterium]
MLSVFSLSVIRRLSYLFGLTILVLLAVPSIAHADLNNFTVTSFHSDETLTRNSPQGELHIVETIKVDFTDNNHGLERAIPEKYKGNSLKFHLNSVTSSSGASTSVSTTKSNGNLVLQIGDPNRTVTGNQEYTIDYTLQNVITFYDNHDELYWNVNGNYWNQTFLDTSATLNLPSDAKPSTDQPVCYTGGYGNNDRGCYIGTIGNQLNISANNSLLANMTLSYTVGFQKGYFTPMTFWQRYGYIIIGLIVPPLMALIAGSTWWFRRGRDAKGRGTIVPEYAPPEGLSPLEAGTVVDFKVDNRDITATIIDLARRGFMKITETKQKRVLAKDKLHYSLTLKNTDFSSLNVYEAKLISAIFSDKTIDSIVKIDDLKYKLSSTSTDLRKSVDKDLVTNGYVKADPHKFAAIGSSFFIVAWVAFYIFSKLSSSTVDAFWPTIVGLVAGAGIFFIFVHFMPARTAKGVAAREDLLGLKMYMEVAEKDRLEKLEGPDAAYAAKTGEPVRTVELFEKLLPYAIVLGVENQWAKQFEGIYINPPDWYAGNWTAFNVGYLAGSLSNGFAPAINNSFSAPSSSSGSGFGGGGFAGGGGGGGGGGGW